MLTEIEELGIKIAVLLRKDMIGFECSKCTDELKVIRNHNGDTDHSVPVFYHDLIGEFFVCPIVMIPKSVILFLDQYDYYEKYPSAAPSYEKVNPRFWEAVKYYENFMCTVMLANEKPAGKSNDNLSKMKKLISKR